MVYFKCISVCVVLYLSLIKEVPGFFLYSHTHKRVASWLCHDTHILTTVSVWLCVLLLTQASTVKRVLSPPSPALNGAIIPHECVPQYLSPLYLPQKNKRTHSGIKAVPEMTVPVQKSPLAWTDITGTQTLWPQSLLVCADWSCIDLSWKCPSGPRRSRCHRGKQAETSAAVRCETQTHRPPMSTSLWTQDVSIGNPRQISILKRFCVR